MCVRFRNALIQCEYGVQIHKNILVVLLNLFVFLFVFTLEACDQNAQTTRVVTKVTVWGRGQKGSSEIPMETGKLTGGAVLQGSPPAPIVASTL